MSPRFPGSGALLRSLALAGWLPLSTFAAQQPRAPAPVLAPVPGGAPARAIPSDPSRSALDRELRETVHVQEVEGELWVKGANYKASFGAAAARYYPFLSSRAPQSYALEIRLDQVTVAGAAIAIERRAAPARDGDLVRYERDGLAELFRLAGRQVEHELVFAHLPRRGAIVARLELRSEMAMRLGTDGVELSNEYGRAVYGNATAVDAAGRSLALASSFDGRLLEIVVPAEFVARAELPLAIDPVIAAFGIEATPAESFAPDVSFDTTGTQVLYCWESEFNANDHDVWADVYDRSGNPLYHGGWIDMTATYWGRPRCASLGASGRFLVVAHVLNPTSGRVEVWGRTRDASTALLSPQFKIAGGPGFDALDPDVGGDPFPSSPSYFLVAYERVYAFGQDHDVQARLVKDDGTLVAGTIVVDGSVATYDSLPSVSKSDGGSAWNLAWQRAAPGGGHDILGARVDWNGVLSSPTFPIAVSPLDHTAPSVSSSLAGSDRWIVAYEEDFGSDHDIMVSGVELATVVETIDLSAFDGAFLYQDQRTPSVDGDGAHFLCAYSELYGTSTVDYDVYASELFWNSTTLAVVAAHQPCGAGYGAEVEAQVASATSSAPAGSSRDFAVVWHRVPDQYAFFSDDILGAAYVAQSGGVVASFCDGASVTCPCGNGSSSAGGCPNSVQAGGAALTWSGAPSTSLDTLQLFAGGLPPGATCLFFQSANSINGVLGMPFGDGVRCAGSPLRRLGVKSASPSGGTLYPALGDLSISIQGQVPLAGTTLVYQVWYRNAAPFCTPSTTNLSNALVAAWTP